MAGITSRVAEEDKKVTIYVSGRFDFMMQREFRDAYRQHEGKNYTFHVNMADTEYMDSSAMGMLLMLRKFVGEDRSRVIIERTSPQVAKVLKIANFEKLFEVA